MRTCVISAICPSTLPKADFMRRAPKLPGTGDRSTMQITQHRTRARGLADLLLPFALIENGILLQQDGSLLAAWLYRGPDMHSATHAEMHALTARLNSILRLGSGWV